MQSELSEIMPCIADKFVIEIANSIHVSRDHIRVQSTRLNKMSRLVDSFTGASSIRQNQVNDNLAQGLEGAFEWLNALTSELSVGFSALKTVNQKMTEVQNSVTDLAKFSLQTQDLLEKLTENVNYHISDLDQRLSLVEAESRAHRQINLLFKQWKANHFQILSPLERLYTVLERLYWGDFGEYYRNYHSNPKAIVTVEDLKQTIYFEAIECLQNDMQIESDEYLHPSKWSKSTRPLSVSIKESYAFMGDWTKDDQMPISYYASQQPEQLSIYVPRILTATKLSQYALNEMFGIRK
ncbi:hypothetical protein HMPREF0017_01263 [Acinetobacter lwoffii SH145]|uniref:diguanylate cyclase regulator RdcB family protein n=1 Tax=Acinetobacter lwoffii TaxID=28090 RepID=UPI0001BBA3A2|nr:diguanylate cyclase regulator RdcB family protein [Acinetobacter lwoffii]EEY90337.1 hypothetical protein HMPREF0017_01263 [Acinetobacter lwoffii SH145]